MQFLSDCSPPVYTKSQMPAASSLHFLLGSFHHMCNLMLQSSHTHIPAPVFWNNTIMVYHNDNLFPEKILPVSFILSSLLSSENIITYILKSGEYKIKRRNRISSLYFYSFQYLFTFYFYCSFRIFRSDNFRHFL